MSHWESGGKSDEWLTPRYIFEAMAVRFDTDVAFPEAARSQKVPSRWFSDTQIWRNSLDETTRWGGFIWMNPPFGERNGIIPWLRKFFDHGNGVALVPDRTSAPWFQQEAARADLMLFLSPKVKFLRLDGTPGPSPSTGTVLLASGARGCAALMNAKKLGTLMRVVR